MSKGSFMKSGIYQILDYIARLVILNILVIIASFSLFIIFSDQWWPWIITGLTFFPSLVSLFKVIKDYEDGNNPAILKPFFKNFIKYYVKSMLATFIIVIMTLLLINSFLVFYNNYNQSAANVIGFYLTISVIIIFLLMIVQLPLVIVNFDGLSIIQYLKLSVVLGFKDFFTSFTTVIIVGVIILITIVYPIITAVIGISLPVYIITKLTYKRYKLLTDKQRSREEK